MVRASWLQASASRYIKRVSVSPFNHPLSHTQSTCTHRFTQSLAKHRSYSLIQSFPLLFFVTMTSNFSAAEGPSHDQVIAATQAVAYSLGSEQQYAIVGGAACLVLGSSRVTADVDLVVPKGKTRDARQLLKKQQGYFSIESRTNHTAYRSMPPVEVEILAPPALFQEHFDDATETIEVNGTRILKPALILNAKCRSILGRATQGKRNTDAEDIQFLLSWCAQNAVYPTSVEVPNASKEFVDYFIANYQGSELWYNAGYDVSRGTVPRLLLNILFLTSVVTFCPLSAFCDANMTEFNRIGTWTRG